MQSKEDKNIIFLRLFPDEDVNKQIKLSCKKHNIKSAIIVSGIGQLKKVQIGYFKEKGNYTNETFDDPLEILSFSGNICKQEDDYNLHIHIVLGDEKKNAIGGHFIDGTISITGEIVILKTDIHLKRKDDEKTGLKALSLE